MLRVYSLNIACWDGREIWLFVTAKRWLAITYFYLARDIVPSDGRVA
jgi:hypothetical protein